MPEIIPFKGIRYNLKSVDIHDVIAPPYDVITPEHQTKLYDRNPHNVVRLILGREENRYESAAKNLEQWLKESVLVRDSHPSVYVLHQEFEGKDKRPVVRKGFVALCHLEDFDKKVVLPHEKTHSNPREDRLKLFKATDSNFSQIFSFYADPEKRVDKVLNGISKTPPDIDVAFEDVQNRLWQVTDARVIRQITETLDGKQIFIADGHHRYETALAYRDWKRSTNKAHTGKELYNYVMMFLTNVDDDGLVIYPTHRVIHSLPSFDRSAFLQSAGKHFIIREFKDEESVLAALESSSVPSFGLLMEGEPTIFLLSLSPTSVPAEIVNEQLPDVVKQLDVTILHDLVLKGLLGISNEAQEKKTNLEYIRDAREAYQSVLKGRAQLAFVMRATKIHQVRDVGRGGHTMPPKSTFFYPKLVSGLVMNMMDNGGAGKGLS